MVKLEHALVDMKRVRGEESRKCTRGENDTHEVNERERVGRRGCYGWRNTNSVLTACRTVTRYL